jgi:hypothetical protein
MERVKGIEPTTFPLRFAEGRLFILQPKLGVGILGELADAGLPANAPVKPVRVGRRLGVNPGQNSATVF